MRMMTSNELAAAVMEDDNRRFERHFGKPSGWRRVQTVLGPVYMLGRLVVRASMERPDDEGWWPVTVSIVVGGQQVQPVTEVEVASVRAVFLGGIEVYQSVGEFQMVHLAADVRFERRQPGAVETGRASGGTIAA